MGKVGEFLNELSQGLTTMKFNPKEGIVSKSFKKAAPRKEREAKLKKIRKRKISAASRKANR